MSDILEIACFNLPSCIIAQESGADRIELCADYESGGITPDYADIIEARKLIHIPLMVMIRPRRGNYVYADEELQLMKNAISFCKQHKIDGVVFGILNPANEINENQCKELLALAKPMQCTFHRAIDTSPDLYKSAETLIALGFDSILSSGGKANALQGTENLKQIQTRYGNKISIVAGGGIRPDNIRQIKNETGCTAFHSAALHLNSKTADETLIHQLLRTIKA